MFITVHLTSDAVRALHGSSGSAGRGLREDLADLGLSHWEPLHPGTTDPELAGQFSAEVDDAAAGEICARLLENPAVTAAYTKPAGAPPSAGEP